jgi:hypothetical protein
MDSQKFAAVKRTTLSSGTAVGATSMSVAAIEDRRGNTLTLTNFGTKGFGTIEPGVIGKEEHFTFTGISGTTISGIKWVLMVDPYTETSGFEKAHAAGVKVVLSTNSPAFYAAIAGKTNDETISGTWDFTASPTVPTPTTGTQAANKDYIDGVAIAGAPVAGQATTGIVRQTDTSQMTAGTATESGASLFADPAQMAAQIQSGSWTTFVESASGDDAYTAATTPSFTPAAGAMVTGTLATANTTGATFALNGETPVAIQKVVSGALGALETGDIIAGVPLLLYRTASVWILVSPSGSLPSALQIQADSQSFTSNGTWTKPTGAKIVQVIAVGAGGGGGSGRNSSYPPEYAEGGGGGGGGALTTRTFLAGDLSSTVSVTVGTGGTGGAAPSGNNVNGNNGVAGGTSSFGAYLYAGGGGAGSGGTASGATAGGVGGGSLGSGSPSSGAALGISGQGPNGGYSAEFGGGGGGNGTNQSTGGAGGSSIFAAGGGGAGGAANQSGVGGGDPGLGAAGGAGGTHGSYSLGGGGAGGSTNGGTGTAGSTVVFLGSGGGGGGGAYNGGGGSVGSGGNGGTYGGGGGGGGAGAAAAGHSATGGTGGAGLVRVITFF